MLLTRLTSLSSAHAPLLLRRRPPKGWWWRYGSHACLAPAGRLVALAPFRDKRLVWSRVGFKPDAALESSVWLQGLAEAGLFVVLLFHRLVK